jgi:predicted aldo/keto reductase-like oxidoreductase
MMQYRKFGKGKKDVSILGFGCMRFPVIDGDSKKIDEEKSSQMLRYAYDNGVNYFDTAYPYHGGESERFVGKFLKEEGIRDKIYLATKLPSWEVKTPEDFDRLFNEQLEKLQTDYIDYYLIHALNPDLWKAVTENGVFEWANRQIAAGRIKELGFSFHAELPLFKEIIDAYDWSFAQIQYNYMDVNHQAGTEGLKYAAEKGISMVIMEPLLGGKLTSPPKEVEKAFQEAKTQRSAVGWALQWLWDQAEVKVILSGMSELCQVEENIALASQSTVSMFSNADHDVIISAQNGYAARVAIPCTHCGYCLPCTVDLKIPDIFGVFNHARMYDSLEDSKRWYGSWEAEKKASACIDCEDCEPKCPQNIVISDWMVKVAQVLEEGKLFEEVL